MDDQLTIRDSGNTGPDAVCPDESLTIKYPSERSARLPITEMIGRIKRLEREVENIRECLLRMAKYMAGLEIE